MLTEFDARDRFAPYGQRLADAAWGAEKDLRLYRDKLPQLAALASGRGLGSMLHDWVWHRLTAEFDNCPDVSFPDMNANGTANETKREMHWFGGRVRMRVKIHHKAGKLRVSYYRTASALSFFNGVGQLALDFEDPTAEGYEPTSMTLAYIMNQERSRFTDLLLVGWSKRKPLWTIELPGPSWGATVIPTAPAASGPPAPEVRTPAEAAEDDTQEHDAE